jgi:hypothetical protein
LLSIIGSGGFVDGVGTFAQFGDIRGLAVDPVNNYIYLSDNPNYAIRRVDASKSYATVTVARPQTSIGTYGFGKPWGLALDSARQVLYVTATATGGYQAIYRVSVSNAALFPLAVNASSILTGFTSAATGAGYIDGSLLTSTFYSPVALSYDPTHQLLYVSDNTFVSSGTSGSIGYKISYSSIIRRISLVTNDVSTVAGRRKYTYLFEESVVLYNISHLYASFCLFH